jgi:hypothetical protein
MLVLPHQSSYCCRVLAVSWCYNSVKLNPLACGCCTAVVALMAIKTELEDPHNVLDNWDINSVDPCSWRMVTCSADGYVSALYVALLCSCGFWRTQMVAFLCVDLLTFCVFAEVYPARTCPESYLPASVTSPGCNLCKFLVPCCLPISLSI